MENYLVNMDKDFIEYWSKILNNISNNNISEVLYTPPVVNRNEEFINEIKDELSTMINWKQYVKSKYFIYPETFIVEKKCKCNQRYKKISEFSEYLDVLYSQYKDYEDFKPELILSKPIMDDLNKRYNQK